MVSTDERFLAWLQDPARWEGGSAEPAPAPRAAHPVRWAGLRRRVISAQERRLAQRGRRLARRRLDQELASYRSDAERAELEAILARHAPEETSEIEQILTRQAAQRSYRCPWA